MEKDLIFFVGKDSKENGLTSTSANHIANMCGEVINELQADIDRVSFVEESLYDLTNGNEYITKSASDKNFLDTITEKLDKIGKFTSLISWLREAIDAKERLKKVAESISIQAFLDSRPDIPRLQPAESPKPITEDDVVAIWSVKKRNAYYSLQAKAATYGKYIHPRGGMETGSYAKAREDARRALKNPNEVVMATAGTLIKKKTVVCSESEIQDRFFQMQQTQRSLQAELNSMKHEIELAIAEDTEKKNKEYSDQCNKYWEWNDKVHARLAIVKHKKLAEIKDLKILIPNDLKDVYDEIKEKGKDK